MASGPRYRVKLRRRREGKTNYYARRELLKSGKIRLVIRRSTKHMRVQFIQAMPNGDITLADASSYKLSEYGWDLNGANIPASYLTGYVAGKMAVAEGIEEAILDLGLQSNSNGSRIYSALKGVLDAGVYVPAGEQIFPDEETIKGKHIEVAAESYEDDELDQVFATYAENNVDAASLPDLVDKVVSTIDGKF